MGLIKSFIVLTFFTSAGFSYADNFTGEQLFAKYKPAVVKLNIFQQGVRISFGSGFFATPDGVILTNKHVIGNGLNGQFRVEVTTADGKTFKEYSVGKCSDKRGIDLCAIKINYKPSVWISPKPQDYIIGQTIYTIGHPKGYDYTFSQGLLSGIRKFGSNKRETDPELAIENVQINAPISPGNSGGPVLNAKGFLIGVVTWTRVEVDSRELSFGVSSNEVMKFISETAEYLPLAAYRDRLKASDKAVSDKEVLTTLKPAWAQLKKGSVDFVNQGGWRKVTLDDGKGITHETFLPRRLAKCHNTKSNFICMDSENGLGMIVFNFMAMKKPRTDLLKLAGKFLPTTPLPLTDELIKSGQWKEISKTLTADQKKYLYSVQRKPIACKEFKDSVYPGFKDSTYCHYSSFNDLEPDGSTFTAFNGKDKYPYVLKVTGWSARTSLSEMYFGYAELAAQLMHESIPETRVPAASK